MNPKLATRIAGHMHAVYGALPQDAWVYLDGYYVRPFTNTTLQQRFVVEVAGGTWVVYSVAECRSSNLDAAHT